MTALAIDADLVVRLLRAQFPHWAELPVARVEPGGWDNRSFRLGDDKVVRLPSAAAYAPQVEKEQHWLSILAPALPIAIPQPLARGTPGEFYPWCWSIYNWLPGRTAEQLVLDDPVRLARSITCFLKALHAIEPAGGPPPGLHNLHRGAPLDRYDAEVREALSRLRNLVDGDRLLALWDAAAASRWEAEPVWLHGDLSPRNLLTWHGELIAVIDFGCCGVGDPACDLAIAWSDLGSRARGAFRSALPLDPQTWVRGRGWAVWKALVTLAHGQPALGEWARRTLAETLADPHELD